MGMKKVWKILLGVSIGLCIVSSSSVLTYYFVHARYYRYNWLDAEPEDYGFSSQHIQMAYWVAEQMPYLRSVLIIRNNTMLAEWYFNDGARNTPYHIMSSTKSFFSAIFGIAVHQGIIPDLDQKMMDYFPEYDTPGLDPRKHNITIRHLLEMKAGFNFNDTAADWELWGQSEIKMKYCIDLPLVHNPGEAWHYCTPQPNLLSAILTKASGMTTKAFADTYLFGPLGIYPHYWSQDPQGYYAGGHEMYFTPREFAQLGLLYLNNGSKDGEQIVSKEWVNESTTDHAGVWVEEDIAMTDGVRSTFYRGTGYGYQWWTKEIRGYYSFSARGFGGQFLYCFPEIDTVVVTTASGDLWNYDPMQYSAIISLIENYIIRSVLW